jgi:hypothetical protein
MPRPHRHIRRRRLAHGRRALLFDEPCFAVTAFQLLAQLHGAIAIRKSACLHAEQLARRGRFAGTGDGDGAAGVAGGITGSGRGVSGAGGVSCAGGRDSPKGEGLRFSAGAGSLRATGSSRAGARILTRRTFAVPGTIMSMRRAAARERSKMRPRAQGPRSLIFTSTSRWFERFFTRTHVLKGSVRCAAVNFSMS